jgi:serine/threonine protein kinase
MHSLKVFHFDIKLENVIMDGPLELSCSNQWVKLVDFGACKELCETEDGLFRSKQGTLCYMAPEVNIITPYAGEPVDVFALA